MRFAFISSILHSPWGGADKLWTQAAEAAVADRHEVLIAVTAAVAAHPRLQALRAGGAQIHLRDGFTLFNGQRSRLLSHVRRRLRHPRSLLAALDSFAPDFAFVSQGGAFDIAIEHGLVAWFAERKCPFVLICQSNAEDETLSPESRQYAAQIVARARHFVFVSTHNRDLAVRQLGQAIPQACIVQNPVELPAGAAPAWPDEAEARFAVVARLDSASKGLDLLITALAAALQGIPNWRVDFFGRGPDEAALRTQADACGLADRVHFCGFHSDVREIWSQHHLLLLPSRREGCSLAMLEALTCGRAVLMTDVGGASDWIEAGINGFVCLPGDAKALAQTLSRAWEARSRWHAMGAEAGRRATANLDPHPGRTLLALAGCARAAWSVHSASLPN
jgi:glycosyltransferase involved in cell wall biosynthesis